MPNDDDGMVQERVQEDSIGMVEPSNQDGDANSSSQDVANKKYHVANNERIIGAGDKASDDCSQSDSSWTPPRSDDSASEDDEDHHTAKQRTTKARTNKKKQKSLTSKDESDRKPAATVLKGKDSLTSISDEGLHSGTQSSHSDNSLSENEDDDEQQQCSSTYRSKKKQKPITVVPSNSKRDSRPAQGKARIGWEASF